MKINQTLMIISIILVSLLAMGMASASDNMTDVIETTDVDEIISVDEAIEDSEPLEEASEDVEILKNDSGNSPVENENESIPTNIGENETVKDTQPKNQYDWGKLYGKNSSDSNLLVFDLSDIFGKNSARKVSLIFDMDNYGKSNNTDGNSYLIYSLSNNPNDNSYLVLGLSSLFGKNNTNDDSFLVLDLPGLGFKDYANSTLVVDLTNLLSENSSTKGSFLNTVSKDNRSSNLNLDWVYNEGIFLFNYNITSILNGNFTDLYRFLDDFKWSMVLSENYTNLTSFLNDFEWGDFFNGNYTSLDNMNWSNYLDGSFSALMKRLNITTILGVNVTDMDALIKFNLTSILDDLNWTALFKGNFTALMDSLNITSILGVNVTDIDALLHFNLTSLIKNLNWTDVLKDSIDALIDSLNKTSPFKYNLTDIASLLDSNLTSALKNFNLTSWLNNLNWTSIIGKNATSNKDQNDDKNSSFDWSKIIGKKDSETGSLIDNIYNWITGKNKNTNTKPSETVVVQDSIKSSNLKTYYDKTTTFKVTVLSGGKAVTNGKVVFTINNKKYTANIGSNGVAVLKIKLKPGTHYVTSTYGKVSVKNKIVVKKSIITKNVSKKYKKSKKFTVKVLNSKGKAQSKQKVKIKLNGKTYTAKTNKKGIATFKLPKKLKVGKYTIKTTCKGLTISNKLTVKR